MSAPSSHDEIGSTAAFAVYENQRWFPIKGWTSSLLPTDRAHFSDKTGKLTLSMESYPLPASYAWLGGWTVVVSEEDTDAEGWRYAVDFPAHYQHRQGPTTMVRRRRWQRMAERRSANDGLQVAGAGNDFVEVDRGGAAPQPFTAPTTTMAAVLAGQQQQQQQRGFDYDAYTSSSSTQPQPPVAPPVGQGTADDDSFFAPLPVQPAPPPPLSEDGSPAKNVSSHKFDSLLAKFAQDDF